MNAYSLVTGSVSLKEIEIYAHNSYFSRLVLSKIAV